MTSVLANVVLRHIRDLAAAENGTRLPDRQLLERFATAREQTAFEALVRRHGPLVLGVCRRVLRNPHDAEDAFQATFLVLARKAGSAGRRASLGTWLYQVAYHTALKVRRQTAVRRQREDRAAPREQPDALAEVTGRELMTVLDEELHQLPERLRAPLVLCYLEGRTRDEAARELGWSLGTLKRRLEQARDVLRARLTRRGLALSAGLLATALVPEAGSAAVPVALAAAAVRAALAEGTAPAAVVEFAAAGLRGAAAAKFKAGAVLMLAVVVAVLGAGALTPQNVATPAAAAPAEAVAAGAKDQAPPAERPGQAERQAPAVPPVPPLPGETKEMTVAGRVLGPDGKPVAGARVAIVARQGLFLNGSEGFVWYRNAALGRARADGDGKFRLTVPRTPPLPVRQVRLVAAGDGLGLAWKGLDPKAESVEAEIRLPAEQVVRGRIVDLQGEPVGGARVHVNELAHRPAKGEKDEGTLEAPPAGLPFGPVTATADAQGRFTFRGLGPNLTAELEVRDDRVELHTFTLDTADRTRAENVKLALPPARIVEGRVTYQDTGKPVAGARVAIVTAGAGDVSGTTDEGGRYRLNVRPPSAQFYKEGKDLGVSVFPPAGEPYWMAGRGVAWVKGASRHEVDVALPRGVLVRGQVTEAGSGKPVAGACIEYNGQSRHRAASAADGSYSFGVPAGATGSLTVNAPSDDYVPQVIGSAEALAGRKGGDRIYYHAVVPLGLKPGDTVEGLPVVLRRGVTLKGRLVGPGGGPVKDAILLVGEHRPPHEKYLHPIRVSDGHFELTGCDPEKTYRLVFVEHPAKVVPFFGVEALNTYGQLWLSALLGEQNKLGAVVEVSAKEAAARPIEVRLAPCGSAKVRFVGAGGKPLAKHKPWVQLVVTPGPPANQAIREGKLGAEVVTLISQYPDPGEPSADGDGVLVLRGLIPGATYRIKQARLEGEVLADFTAEAGKTLELTVTVK